MGIRTDPDTDSDPDPERFFDGLQTISFPKTRIPLVQLACLNKNIHKWGDEMPSQTNEIELVRVPGGINAESIVTALHGHGIPARYHGEAVGAIYGLTLDGLGEVSIFVPEEYLEQAKSVLAAGEHGDLLLSDGDTVDGMESDSH